jgi:hypothetical protein
VVTTECLYLAFSSGESLCHSLDASPMAGEYFTPFRAVAGGHQQKPKGQCGGRGVGLTALKNGSDLLRFHEIVEVARLPQREAAAPGYG